MKNNFFKLLIGVSIISIGIVVACSQEQNLDFMLLEQQHQQSQQIHTNFETATFKSTLLSLLQEKKAETESNEISFTNNEIALLKAQSIEMFESHGFTKNHIDSLTENNDEQLIIIATLFTGMLEAPATNIMKTRGESGGNSVCFDAERIVPCILEATGIHELTLKGCLTKTVITETISKCLSKVAPQIALAVALADFAICMGWLSW